MKPPRSRHVLALLAGALSLVSAPADACSIPVFRYALERFPADPYRAVIFHRGPLSAQEKELADALKALAEAEGAQVNVELELVDLAAAPATGGADTPVGQKRGRNVPPAGATLPWLVLGYPEGALPAPAWSGPFNAEAVRGLFDSPARRELAARLLKKGESAIFVLVESGQKEPDEAAAKLLQSTLAGLEKELKLPEQDGEVQMNADLPLRILFTTLRVSRADPAEKLFLQTLLNTDSEVRKETGPIVFPVFGRGRTLGGLAGKMLDAATLQEACEFLCGACMCSIKQQMPGVDLLITADWGALGTDQGLSAMPPLLQGLSPLARAAASAQEQTGAGPLADARGSAINARGGLLQWALAGVLAGGAVLIVVMGLLLKARARKGRE